MTMFESWSNAKLYVVDTERYANMHWKDIGDDLLVRRQLCEEAGEIMISKIGYESISKGYPEGIIDEDYAKRIPYSFTFMQYSDAVISFNENTAQWIVLKNRYNCPPRWEGSNGDLVLAMNNWMMERVLC